MGGGNHRSWKHNEDWDPAEPDILPGDTVSATTNGYATIIETVGEIKPLAHNDTDVVEGTIHAPWFSPGSLLQVAAHRQRQVGGPAHRRMGVARADGVWFLVPRPVAGAAWSQRLLCTTSGR
jgi:hypothetical protein